MKKYSAKETSCPKIFLVENPWSLLVKMLPF
jgi:hypothetical protein